MNQLKLFDDGLGKNMRKTTHLWIHLIHATGREKTSTTMVRMVFLMFLWFFVWSCLVVITRRMQTSIT